jgi:hypothetical protein
VRTIFLSYKYLKSYTQDKCRIQHKCEVFRYFCPILINTRMWNFGKTQQYQILWKSAQRFSFVQMDRWRDFNGKTAEFRNRLKVELGHLEFELRVYRKELWLYHANWR